MQLVPVCGLDCISRDAHRVHADDNWCANLDRTFQADLCVTPEILDLQRFAFRKTNENNGPITFQAVHTVRILESEPTTDLRHWHIGTR
jgi:hypothetical protein